jgi:hypothetical protein
MSTNKADMNEEDENGDAGWMDEEEEIKYMDDPAYRLSCGPSIERWGECGYDESLVGVKIVFNFQHHGECRGVVRGIKELRANDDRVFHVVWTSSPNHNEEFLSELNADEVVGWHFRGSGSGKQPLWVEHEFARDCSLFTAPEGSTLVDFALPVDLEYVLPCLEDRESEEYDRWEATIQRLNDPSVAHIFCPAIKEYPLPFVLAMIVVMKEQDPSTRVPMIVTDANKEVFALTDKFTRHLNNNPGYRTGYGSLMALEKLIQTVESKVSKASSTADAINADKAWRQAYVYLESLVLTMSNDFEKSIDSWMYADDPSRVMKASADIVAVAGSILLNRPPLSDVMEELVAKNQSHMIKHLKAGSFTQLVFMEEFETEYPAAAYTWKQLVGDDD